MFTVTHLTVGYGAYPVIENVSLTVQPGECVAILGRNGAGKTTLINALAGVIPTTRGDVTLNGTALTALSADRRHAAGVTLVPQGHRIFSSLTVDEHLVVSLKTRGTNPFDRDEIYRRFPVLHARRDQRAGTLSGGEQQMLALARALAGNGQIMLLDEPTEGLDPQRRALLVDTVKDVCARGVAVVLVEQRVDAALRVANRALLLNGGELNDLGDVAVLRDDPRVIANKLGMTSQ